MGYTKDLWTRPARLPDGTIERDAKGKPKREPNARWGKGKRWQANWTNPDGEPDSRVCPNKAQADRLWRDMESDRDRGDYRAPNAGKELLDPIARRWLASRNVDPKSQLTYERAYRLHIKPQFGNKPVRSIKASHVQELLSGISDGNRQTVRLVLGGIFDLAVADEMLRSNPVSSAAVAVTKSTPRRVRVWADSQVGTVIDAHPPELQVAPIILAGCGLRESELFGLDVADVEDGDDAVLRVRRQVKYLGAGVWVYAMPKGDKERDVPLPGWVAQAVKAHPVKPLTLTLPWERSGGKLVTQRLLVSHHGEHLRSWTYNQVWRPALAAAGIIGPAAKNNQGRMRYPSDRHAGRHALRHYYASVMLADGVNIRELADYLGHHDPGFTLRVYGHLLPDSHERARKAIDNRLFRPRAV